MMLITACKKSEIYPSVPQIEFKSAYRVIDNVSEVDTLLGVIFSYKDGDGDIGLNTEDTFPPFNSVVAESGKELNPYHYNLNIEYLALKNGKFEPVIIPNTTDTLRFQARFQNITPEAKYKAIRGDIDWRILLPPYPGISRTIKLKIYIYDRALHKSNVAESTVINL